MKLSFSRFPVVLSALLLTGLNACNDEEIGSSRDVNPDRIYADYHFTAYEEGGDIALKMQFRFGGPQGTTLVLENPSQVTVDGVRVPVDSSGIDGAFYETVRPFSEFAGQHRIEYTDASGKKYVETVEFPVFQLEGVLPDTIPREGLELPLAGVGKGDFIQVMLTDTAAYSKGIEKTDSLEAARLVLSRDELAPLKAGPINFQLIRHRIRPLEQPTPEGGRLTVTYSISREVFIR